MTPAAISLLVCIVLVILVMAYYWFQLRKKPHSSSSTTASTKQSSSKKTENRKNNESDPILAKVKPMYKPAEVGHRSGRQKLFLTSKGLRSYETNEFGFPMPDRKEL